MHLLNTERSLTKELHIFLEFAGVDVAGCFGNLSQYSKYSRTKSKATALGFNITELT